MKLETKQNEVILVAESDLDKFYLQHFFYKGGRPFVIKSEDPMNEGETIMVTITYERPEQ